MESSPPTVVSPYILDFEPYIVFLLLAWQWDPGLPTLLIGDFEPPKLQSGKSFPIGEVKAAVADANRSQMKSQTQHI